MVSHGGPDGGPPITDDFSTNANPLGPPPALWQAVLQADRRRYPDPGYTGLRERLAAAHGVTPARIIPTAGGAEAIRRLTLAARLRGVERVCVPQPGFGDYAAAARALGMQVDAEDAGLRWFCEPCNPSGVSEALPPAQPGAISVVDRACEPLRLSGSPQPLPPGCWELHCPNKALGLTGVRAAYLIAPDGDDLGLPALAPSWVLSSEGVAMLNHWHDDETSAWLAASRSQLRAWAAAQREMLDSLGWQQNPSCTNFWLARPRLPLPPDLRERGIKLRDAASFGLPGWVRIAALPPASQQALKKALGP